MEILYVCELKDDYNRTTFSMIKEYKFSGNYDIYFNKEAKRIEIKNQKRIPQNFYNSSISNISCILGNNGSGKTSTIDYLITILTKTFSQYIVILCEENEKLCIYKNKKINISSKIEKEIIFKDLKEFYDDFTIMLYSNVFNNQHYLLKRPSANFIDLSSIGLLNDTETSEYENDRILNFFRNEVKQQVKFRKKYDVDRILPFNPPNILNVYIVPIENILQHDSPYRQDLIDLIKKMKIHPHENKQIPTKKSPDQKISLNLEKDPLLGIFETEIIRQVFISLFSNICYGPQRHDESVRYLIQTFNEFFNGMVKEDILNEGVKKLEEITESLKILDNVKYIEVEQFINFLKYLYSIKDTMFDYINIRDVYNHQIDLDMNYEESERFLQHYFSIITAREMFKFDWKMSSGEFALFSLFSRFDSINRKVGDNVLILIDEIDCLLHPRWQQQIIKKLIESLPIILKNKHIQLLISTHSPILLSDIPKSCVSYLDRDDESQGEETFGANLSTLYYDSFSLKKGSIGDFAKSKIDALFNAMVEVSVDDDGLKKVTYKKIDVILHTLDLTSEDELEKYISLVGEPIIKKKLLWIFEQCKRESKND